MAMNIVTKHSVLAPALRFSLPAALPPSMALLCNRQLHLHPLTVNRNSGNLILNGRSRPVRHEMLTLKVSPTGKFLRLVTKCSQANELAKKKCVPCESKDLKPMSVEVAEELLQQVPGWNISNQDGKLKLQRAWKVKSFIKGLEFFKHIADIAEAEDAWWDRYGRRVPHLQKLAVRVLSQTCSSSGCERNWSVFEKIHTKKRNRLDTQRLNDMVYVYYNLRLWVKQIQKTPDVTSISLDEIDTTAAWRIETERPLLESAHEWIEDDAVEPGIEADVEGVEVEDWLEHVEFTYTDDAAFQEEGHEAEAEAEAEAEPEPESQSQRFVLGQGLGAVGGSSSSGPSASTSRAHQGAFASTSGARVPPPPARGSSSSRGRRPPVRATPSRATSGRPPLPASSGGRATARAVSQTLSRKRGKGN